MKRLHKSNTQGMPKAQSKRKSRIIKQSFVLVLVLVLFAGIGSAYAWSMHETTMANNLQSQNTFVDVEEVFTDGSFSAGDIETKQVSFRNNGSSAVFLRVAYAEYWGTADEWLLDDGSHAIKHWTDAWSMEWEYQNGWYYYKHVLPAGEATARVLESVEFPNNLDQQYASQNYELSFIVEAVQLSSENSVNEGATLSVFGRSATVSDPTIINGAVTAGAVTWSMEEGD